MSITGLKPLTSFLVVSKRLVFNEPFRSAANQDSKITHKVVLFKL
jgi:hypothetical protein